MPLVSSSCSRKIFPVLMALVLALPVSATEGAVASGHPLATQAGIAMLKQGGNAFDAAVATAFAIGVVEPEGSGIGGGGFAVVYDSVRKQARALDFREVAPLRASSAVYQDRTGTPQPQKIREGILAVAVPGQVRGLVQLQRTYGKLKLSQVMAPAIRLADQGFAVSIRLNGQLTRHRDRLVKQKASAQIWYPKGQVPKAGSVLRQKDLAKTLKAIARSSGESFYTGATSRLWIDFMKQEKGLVSAQDLKNYRPLWRDPLVGFYRDYTVVSMPLPSSGGVHLIQMLNMLNLRDLRSLDPSQRSLLMAETMKRAFADRSRFLGDPASVPVPVTALLNPGYAKLLVDSIQDPPVPSAQIIPGALMPNTVTAAFTAWENNNRESQDTSHLSVIDGLGNAVSLTQTINGPFGAGLVVPGTGVWLNNEMDDFALAPGIPNQFGLVGGAANAIKPNKRPLSSMTPTLVFKANRPWLALGGAGGSFIITSVLQTLVNVIDLDQPLQEAISQPRIHHQWLPDQLSMEPENASAVQTSLEKSYTLRSVAQMGGVQAVLAQPLNQPRFMAGADLRREGTGQVWMEKNNP